MASEKLEKLLLCRCAIKGFNRRGDSLRVRNCLRFRGLDGRIVLVDRCDRNVSHPENVTKPKITKSHCGLKRLLITCVGSHSCALAVIVPVSAESAFRNRNDRCGGDCQREETSTIGDVLWS